LSAAAAASLTDVVSSFQPQHHEQSTAVAQAAAPAAAAAEDVLGPVCAVWVWVSLGMGGFAMRVLVLDSNVRSMGLSTACAVGFLRHELGVRVLLSVFWRMH
jgi:hypothetical protein